MLSATPALIQRRGKHPEDVRMLRSFPAVGARRQSSHAVRWRRPVTVLAVGVVAVLALGWWSTPTQCRPPPAAGHQAGHVFVPGPLSAGVAAADDGPATDTSWGPLTAADRDLLVRVKLAGLWEVPAGDMAQTRSTDQRVKAVGRVLAADHRRLNAEVAVAARKLQVTLPDRPNLSQQGWLDEMTSERGHPFDETFANRLRTAHGVVFGVIAEVRDSTRNTMVRAFASEANDVVMKHMSLLESTGFVAPTAADVLAPPAPRGPITTELVVVAVVLVGAANLALAARRSWA
jgi:predicted outer membrane protein